jgi:muconolactone delta-isomerase
MQFLLILRRVSEKFTSADFASRAGAEVERARTLYSEGFIRQIWHHADGSGATSLLEADSEETVRAKIDTLPMLKAGMLEIVTLTALKPYAGFGPRG